MTTGGTRRERARDPYALLHGSTAFHVAHYDLDLTYRVRTNRLTGTATLRIRTREILTELRLDLVGLAVTKVQVAGATLARHQHRAGRLVLQLADEVAAETVLTVTVRYGGRPGPIPSPWGPVGWEELEDGVVVASQPTGAPTWFPCNDRPADKATYRTAVTAENPYRVVAHGVLVDRRVRGSSTTWVYEELHPTASYLATVQIGRYAEILLASVPVPQRAVLPAHLVPLARRRLAEHGAMMAAFSTLFGPYPFPSYTVVVTADELEIPLEAQSLSIFGANHLAPTRGDERLIPHELAHQWFGNSVSVASWQHLWLNEGFACYAEWLWSEASGGKSADSLARLWHTRLAGLPQDLVLADPGPAHVFDDRVYKRGALTLHALRGALGDDAFFALVRAWTKEHADLSVTTTEFRGHCAAHATAVGGASLALTVATLLAGWLDSPLLPAPTKRPAGRAR
ncbi:M1 family metallopeptidase [Pengzhenrongella frigida]|uniref:Aminopeptidase N n=1 Tax=Pengzhenrongella frigida TaxID=1259133 RepID=A0A4Q5MW05_9MICO|nr:M1 family metallopeptidase [Cellulomonas sp. HLT2-17]RYV49758.1 M1 family peptidase [Cellulomonas sp. HLT2-17]